MIAIPVLDLVGFGTAAILIGFAGTRLTRTADTLADLTGWGEAVTGAVLLGATTSLPGITASVTAAASGYPTLAVSNAIGGITAQTSYLAVADIAYRRVNLEHAAASVPNMMSGALLVILLATLLLTMTGPEVALWGLHPASPTLVVIYIAGLRLVRRAHNHPMWLPRRTHATRTDEPDSVPCTARRGRLYRAFFGSAVIVVVAGWILTRTASNLAKTYGVTESLMGGVFVALITSLPELVTSVAAVRQGALTMAVGGVLGGNAFDTLFAAVADATYRPGSIYHAVSPREPMLTALGIIMTGALLLGLLVRERRGIANIGFESAAILGLFALGVAVLAIP